MNPDAATGVIAGAIISILLIVLVYVWASLALATVFRKAGEQGWKGWVPFVNTGTVLGIGGFSPWLVLLVFLPVVGQLVVYVLLVIAAHRINRSFGYGGGMTVLAALLFLIWASVLGFGSARWIGAPVAGPVRSPQPAGEPVPPLVGGWVPTPLGVPGFGAAESAPPVPGADADAPAGPWGPPPSARQDTADNPLAGLFDADVDDAVDPEDRVPTPPTAPIATSFAPPSPPLAEPPAEPAEPVAPAEAAAHPQPPAAAPGVVPISSVPGVRADAPGPAAPEAPEPVPVAPAEPVGEPVRDVWPAPVAWPAPPPEPARRSAAPPEPESSLEREPSPEPGSEPEPFAPAPPVAREPAPDDDEFPEPSEAVSAVAGAPDAGSPRSARSSVSALYAQPEIPAEEPAIPEPLGGAAAALAAARRPAPVPVAAEDADADDPLDRTIIARRRRTAWKLVPPAGAPIDITSDIVILGRRPTADPAYPDAQLIPLVDETRTVSKTHARLELRKDTWYVTDLGSTNGVLFATLMGTEVEAQPGQELEAGERFFLGDAEVRLRKADS